MRGNGKRVAVTGASGFVGRSVVEALRRGGYEPIALGRNPQALPFAPGVERRRFEPNDPEPNPRAFEGSEAVIHLAGESVAGRWTASKKKAIYASRVEGTRNVATSLEACSARPTVLVSASASGYYGARGDEPLFETSPAGDDFLARVCVDWEREASSVARLGIRSIQMRTGVVLGSGGALTQMAAPFRFGVGGPFGSGRQFLPWIHVDDLAALYVFCLESPDVEGAVNAVAPDYATNGRFARALGAALLRPALLPAPAPALRVVLGEFAESVLASQLMIPAVAEDAGFTWRHRLLEAALLDVLAPDAKREPAIRLFESRTLLSSRIDEVFQFFSDARNLATITPPSLRFTNFAAPVAMERGTQIEYTLRLHGLPIRWKTMIASWKPPHCFVDVQLHGPYALWRHTHEFAPLDGGVTMHDRVEYALPFFPLGELGTPLVESDIRSIFTYRAEAIQGRFGRSGAS